MIDVADRSYLYPCWSVTVTVRPPPTVVSVVAAEEVEVDAGTVVPPLDGPCEEDPHEHISAVPAASHESLQAFT
jgi:hypothetical protein